MALPKNNDLLKNARTLRKEMTPQELRLWYRFLRTYPVKIYKQRIIGNYIVDFYCASAKLVIEVDGSQHFDEDAFAYDTARTAFFSANQIQVIRFTNADINQRFSNVCETVEHVLETASASKE